MGHHGDLVVNMLINKKFTLIKNTFLKTIYLFFTYNCAHLWKCNYCPQSPQIEVLQQHYSSFSMLSMLINVVIHEVVVPRHVHVIVASVRYVIFISFLLFLKKHITLLQCLHGDFREFNMAIFFCSSNYTSWDFKNGIKKGLLEASSGQPDGVLGIGLEGLDLPPGQDVSQMSLSHGTSERP